MQSNLAQMAKKFYTRLNGVPAAKKYLDIFNKQIQFNIKGTKGFHIIVKNGMIDVKSGKSASKDKIVFESDADTMRKIFSARLSWSEAGGGMGGSIVVMDGPAFWRDISWVGNLTRLSQESR